MPPPCAIQWSRSLDALRAVKQAITKHRGEPGLHDPAARLGGAVVHAVHVDPSQPVVVDGVSGPRVAIPGLTKARQIRDLCVTLNLPMTIEDSWGGDIITAAIAHLAHSTPEPLRFSATDFNSYVTVRNATGAPQREDGQMRASDAPGLGIEPDMDVLGKPVAVYPG